MFNWLKKLLPENFFLRRWYSTTKAAFAAFRYDFPAKKLTIIGVTGTDGKTTTTEMIFHILRVAGKRAAKISSASFSKGSDTWLNTTKRTTVSPFVLQKFLDECVNEEIEFVVIEVSSHALAQQRVFGVDFNVAVLTNISHEHLDYHGTIENLRAAKKLLFTEFLTPEGAVIINADDPVAELWQAEIPHMKTYSFRNSSYYKGEDFAEDNQGLSFRMEDTVFSAHVFGEFNGENALAAIAACREVGLMNETISFALAEFSGVDGRLQNLDFGQNFQIFVDYAITPRAFERVLGYLKGRTNGRLIVVFGATGDHDKEKRPILGKIARQTADIVVLTDDETYTEDPEKIRHDIKTGIFAPNEEWESDDFHEIADRKTAIETALQLAGEGDSVAVLGMGALETRNMGGKEVPWSDRQAITAVFTAHLPKEE